MEMSQTSTERGSLRRLLVQQSEPQRGARRMSEAAHSGAHHDGAKPETGPSPTALPSGRHSSHAHEGHNDKSTKKPAGQGNDNERQHEHRAAVRQATSHGSEALRVGKERSESKGDADGRREAGGAILQSSRARDSTEDESRLKSHRRRLSNLSRRESAEHQHSQAAIRSKGLATSSLDASASGAATRASASGEHSAPSIGQMSAWAEQVAQPAIKSSSSYGINQARGLNYAMPIGLPCVGLLALALALFLALRLCRRPKQKCSERLADARSGQQKQQQQQREQQNSGKKNCHSIIDFISNGKLYTGARGVATSLKPQELINKTFDLGNGAKQRQKQWAYADTRQLTINMEGQLESGQSGSSTQTEDSDEQGACWKKARGKRGAGSAPGSGSKAPARKPQLKYGLSYDFGRMELTVSILEARDLPALDLNGYSDPYVKVSLVSNCSESPSSRESGKQSSCFKTKIHKRTLNPVFNETFKFELPYAELTSKRLLLTVLDYDRLTRHDEIGQTSIALQPLDLAQEQEHWAELEKWSESGGEERLGDICLSLRYVPTAGKLNVVVLEARQLKKMDLAGLSDPYVKLALVNGEGKRLKKKKTSIKKCTLNPHYNESFSFELPFELVQQVQLLVTVVDYDRIGTSEPIGKIALGCQRTSGESELRHWLDMLASPRRPIAQWHALKDMDHDFGHSSASSAAPSAQPAHTGAAAAQSGGQGG